MADRIRITNSGFVAVDWNPDTQSHETEPTEEILGNLRTTCEIDEDVTLGRIFEIVSSDPVLKVVMKAYSWCSDIDGFHAAAKLPPTERKDVKPEEVLTHIEISKVCDVHDPHKSETKGDFQYWEHMAGVSANGERWAIGCLPMGDIQHLPVKLNTDIVIRKNFADALWEGRTHFTLLEVLDAIYFDISFYGGPEENKKFLNDLLEMSNDIEEGLAGNLSLDN
jgi:hypothetical protein